jgi:hypothetical protein
LRGRGCTVEFGRDLPLCSAVDEPFEWPLFTRWSIGDPGESIDRPRSSRRRTNRRGDGAKEGNGVVVSGVRRSLWTASTLCVLAAVRWAEAE